MDRERKIIPSDAEIKNAISVLCAACHGRAWNAGWWHDIETGQPKERSFSDIGLLLHSEISEAFEAHRTDSNDDKLTHRKGVPVEIADLIIRAFDFLGGDYPDDAICILEKMQYNDNRADHKIENRKKEGGKKL